MREKGENVPFADVSVLIAGERAVTDDDGRLPLRRRSPSARTRSACAAPTSPAISTVTLTLTAGKRLEVTWYLARKQRYPRPCAPSASSRRRSSTRISGEELRHIPGTQGDTLRAVQTLPGVARAAFGGGAIIVWGTSPASTRSYVDGVYIPTLYHFGGLRSTVNGEMVQDLTFMPGGFGVEYGRGYGGVIEIDTRKPKDNGIHGFVQLDLIDASLMLDAKLTKTLSVTVAARRSTIDAWLPLRDAEQLSAHADLLGLPGQAALASDAA